MLYTYILLFCFYKCLVTRSFKKVQHRNQSKNSVFSDYTKLTYCEIYSSIPPT